MRKEDRYTIGEQIADQQMAQNPGTTLTLIFAAEIGLPSFWVGERVLEAYGMTWLAWVAGIAAFLVAIGLISSVEIVRNVFILVISCVWAYLTLDAGHPIGAVLAFCASLGLHMFCLNNLIQTGRSLPDDD